MGMVTVVAPQDGFVTVSVIFVPAGMPVMAFAVTVPTIGLLVKIDPGARMKFTA
jgi:hypothetical protein